MFRNRDVIRQVGCVALGEVVCVALMLLVYALLGQFTAMVLRGALLGCLLAILNFFLLSVVVTRAADRAASTGESARAAFSVQFSAVWRLLGMAAILIAVFRAGLCDPVAALLPLLFIQASIYLTEFFRRDGEKKP